MPVEDRLRAPYDVEALRSDIDNIKRLGELHLQSRLLAGRGPYALGAYELLERAQSFYGKPFDALPEADKFYENFRVRFLLPKLKKFMDQIFNDRNHRGLHGLSLVSRACKYPEYIWDIK